MIARRGAPLTSYDELGTRTRAPRAGQGLSPGLTPLSSTVRPYQAVVHVMRDGPGREAPLAPCESAGSPARRAQEPLRPAFVAGKLGGSPASCFPYLPRYPSVNSRSAPSCPASRFKPLGRSLGDHLLLPDQDFRGLGCDQACPLTTSLTGPSDSRHGLGDGPT